MPPDLFPVLYLDNHLLVVHKPAGLLSQADRTGDPDILTLGKAFLKHRFDKPGNVYLGLVHRLDRPVSGVMVLARTSKAAARLTKQFRDRQPEKKYLALLEGQHQGGGRCEDFLVKEKQRVRVVAPAHPQGKRAVLQWRILAHRAQESLAEVTLETGRPHQIRVQMAHRGMPLLGDLRYGARRIFDGRNLALHCAALTLVHPTQKVPMTWVASPPPTWAGYFDAARHAYLASLVRP